MSQQLVNAVFENGLFRPLEPLHIPVCEGAHVRLHIEERPKPTSLELGGEVYDGLSESEIDEIERIALDRTNNAAHFARIPGLQIDNWSR